MHSENQKTCFWVVCEVLDDGTADTKHFMQFDTERAAMRHMRLVWSMGRRVQAEVRWL